MMQRKVLAGTVMLMVALGLTGCVKSSSAPATNESHVRSARVAKSSSHKSSRHESSASVSSTQNSAKTATSQYATTQQSNATSQAATQNSNQGSTNQAVVNNGSNHQATASSHSEQRVQLGLGDVAVWTENGVTHHVDSDGMDRQTTNGSSTIHYSDWSGQLPQGVQVQHN
ncbi:hypothetical protein [[Lactobacillus] timonensis]|uniref:hypothetical protein n=1 Tax=[Lactobacillus] timonensis TaxID=1970790 RepID=UPI001F3C9006|nr:hypothetical protein [[Lactobacillus] timonensis]